MVTELEDFADYLADEALSDVAAVHEFIASYQGANEIHAFFEGEDDFFFYLPEIRRRAGDREIHAYYCGGKWNVVSARDAIEASYDASTLFFVDRDFDDFLGRQASSSERTFITEGYSIESYLVTPEAIDILLHDVLLVPRRDCKDVSRRIHEALGNSLNRLYLISAYALAAKEEGLSPNLSNVKKLKFFCRIQGDQLTICSKSFSTFRKMTDSGKGHPSCAGFLKWLRFIKEHTCHVALRGKFHSMVFCKAVEIAILGYLAAGAASLVPRIALPESLCSGDIVRLLGGRIPVSPKLSEFLDRTVGAPS